ncbi:hypothetical protein KAX02_02005 [candidate division WOR-3 bacterium]|nr:hypothetical protein [candidate division WOR-3 bacterium]
MREIRERENDKYELFNDHLGFIIKDILLKVQQGSTLTHQAMKNITKSFDEFRKSWKQITDSLTIALEWEIRALPRFQEFVKKVEERIAEAKEISKTIMLETGYWYTPSFMEIPIEDILEAYNNHLKGNKAAMANFFKRVYHTNNYRHLRKTVDGWNDNTLFQSRMRIILDALDSHCSKRYTLSIPALLPVAEGIATEYCKKVGIYKKKMKWRGNQKIQNALEDKRSKTALNILSLDLFFNAIDEIIYKNTDKLKKAKSNYKIFLNRHAVLHGIQNNYATAKNSLQCFMLLDVLSLL